MEGNENITKHGIDISQSNVEVGETYPVYGKITKIINETPGEVIVQLNDSVIAHLSLSTEEKVELIKTRAFDPGIFIATILEKAEYTLIDCHTIIFGKRTGFDA